MKNFIVYSFTLTIPQSIVKICPDIECALSEIKKSAISATSCGSKNFLSGWRSVIFSIILSFRKSLLAKSVFVIVGATFGTYLLNPLALRHLRASTVTVFIYLQPLIAGIFAIIMGSDAVTVVKILASALIFLGVYLVTKQVKSKAIVPSEKIL